MIEIQEGAIFVADAHYQKGHREDFFYFLRKIETGEIETTQLILMGDCFDLLVGNISHTVEQNRPVINLLNTLSHQIEIIYIEGNHDFYLSPLFPNIHIVPIAKQPMKMLFKHHKIALAHGDNTIEFSYRFYTAFIRNPFLLHLLNQINNLGNHFITKKILAQQKLKRFCKKKSDFERYAKQKLKNYDIATNRFDLICEGHYHLDRDYRFESVRYKFFISYACDKSYYQIQTHSEEVVFNHLKD